MFIKHVLEFSLARQRGGDLKRTHLNFELEAIEPRAVVPRACNPVDLDIRQSR